MKQDKFSDILPSMKLYLHIKHPNCEACYNEGYQSALEEMLEQDNPYQNNTQEYNYWQDGWWDGVYQNAPVFDLSIEGMEQETLEAKNIIIETPGEIILKQPAANNSYYSIIANNFISSFLGITGTLAATAMVGYQVIDLVA